MDNSINKTEYGAADTIIQEVFQTSIDLQTRVLAEQVARIREIAALVSTTFHANGKLVLVGNGGSAAIAQHIATELIGRFLLGRQPLPALALSADSSVLTAVGNDFGFDCIFARQVDGLVGNKDLVVGISASGNSANILNAIYAARHKGARTAGFTGQNGGMLQRTVDICLCIPTESTPRIQELHLVVWHAICQIVELEFSGPR